MFGSDLAVRPTGYPGSDVEAFPDQWNALLDVVAALISGAAAAGSSGTATDLNGDYSPSSGFSILLSTGMSYLMPSGEVGTLTSDDLWTFTTAMSTMGGNEVNYYYLEATSLAGVLNEGTPATAAALAGMPTPSSLNSLIAYAKIETVDGGSFDPGVTDLNSTDITLTVGQGVQGLGVELMARVSRLRTT